MGISMLLVTGGAGYIGSHFVKSYLSKPGSEIVVVDNLSEGHRRALHSLGDELTRRIHLIEADIADESTVAEAMERFNVDSVMHFASLCYVGDSEAEPSKYFENNIAGSLKLFKVMDALGVKKIVFSSSCATYGNPKYVPLDESHPQNPVSVYGLTKYIVEQALQSYGRTKDWSTVCLRYFNAAGADESGQIGESHEPETHLIPRVLKAAKGEIDHLEVFGDDYDTEDGTCIRDYVHVNDLAEAHCLALDLLNKKQCNEAINLGTADGASVKQVIDLSKEITGKDFRVVYSKRRAGDVSKLIANCSKAKELLGWQPRYDLRKTITTAWNWEQNRRY